jgi:anti-sigma factor RsiW
MECASARELLHDLRRGRLDPVRAAQIRAHLEACAGCAGEEAAEAALDEALAERLPRYPAPSALRRRVEELASASWGAPPAARPPRRSRPALRRVLGPAAVAAMALLTAGVLYQQHLRIRGEAVDRLADDVVTDHLRLLASAHPHDLESSLNHEVKPWFEGRLDFAPVVPGDRGELRLLGGAVGYVLDRKAAVMSYALRRHRVTLLAFPSAGISWPGANRTAGGVPAYAAYRRGFGVVLWRAGDLAYALVSDVNAKELEALAAQLAPETRA